MKRGLLVLLLVVLVAGGFCLFSSPSGNLAIVKLEGGLYESDPLVRVLDRLEKDPKVKAVVLRIDSPGGSVGAAQELYEAIGNLAARKKVSASMGAVAASGGYYVALPCHKIYANSGTITGSIGVRMEYLNVEELLNWAKLRPETLKSGKWKDVGSPIRPMSPEEREYLQALLQKMHQQFRSAVASARHLEEGRVASLTEGQVYTGEEAKELGLIDELGGLQAATRAAAELAGIPGEPKVFYPEKEYDSWSERILGKTADGLVHNWGRVNSPWIRFSYE